MRVDAWMQHPTPGFLAHDMFASLRRWTGGQMATAQHLPVSGTRPAPRAGGDGRGGLNASGGPDGWLISNDDVAGFVAERPDRLAGLASVDLRDPVRAVRELRRAVRDLGLKGLRIVPWLWGLPPNDRRYYPLYAECVELGVPFCT